MVINHLKGSGITSEYVCELTELLDKLSGLSRKEEGWSNYHYILIDKIALNQRCLPIRVHGGTVGALYFDEKYVITKVVIDTDYVVKTYTEDVKEQVNKFVGNSILCEGINRKTSINKPVHGVPYMMGGKLE